MTTAIRVTDKVMGQTLEIPTIPEVFARISSMANDPDVGTADIGAVVATDPPLASKVLRIVNSAVYGLREKVASCEHATSVIGIRTLRNVVLEASVMGEYDHLDGVIDMKALWRHSILTAHLCGQLGRLSSVALPVASDELYTCGLLHDLGIVVLLDCAPDEYGALLQQAGDHNARRWEMEEEQLGFTHTDVGAMVARRWSLPDAIVGAILHHHDPSSADDHREMAALVHLADGVAHRIADGGELDESFLSPDTERVLGLTMSDLLGLADFARDAWETIEI